MRLEGLWLNFLPGPEVLMLSENIFLKCSSGPCVPVWAGL